MAEAALYEDIDDLGYERLRTWLNDRCGTITRRKRRSCCSSG